MDEQAKMLKEVLQKLMGDEDPDVVTAMITHQFSMSKDPSVAMYGRFLKEAMPHIEKFIVDEIGREDSQPREYFKGAIMILGGIASSFTAPINSRLTRQDLLQKMFENASKMAEDMSSVEITEDYVKQRMGL